MAVKVQFEIGHTSKLRNKKTLEGFTHDWELYVQGVNKADIYTFVDKVVFNLHESFPKPKRVCKEPPFIIQESGYAGFLLPIDIYFRNRDEPKRVQFTYDLDLQQNGPPHHRSEVKKFIFECPTDDLRAKLLKGGGVPVAGVIGGSLNTTPNATPTGGDEGMVSKPKLSSGESSGKKYKSRTDDSKINAFANLFGTPITKSGSTKELPDVKSNTGGRGGGGVRPTTPISNSGNSNSNTGNLAKEKPSKDKGNAAAAAPTNASAEKTRERSEKKKELKQASPNKEGRAENKKGAAMESNKPEKRSDEKSKKDKSRDKERDRSREKGSNSSSAKRALSPKSNARDSDPNSKMVSPQLQPGRLSTSCSSNIEESKSSGGKSDLELKVKESKKEQNSSSSGKKSKKEKRDKDKDKDRDKEKREEHKEKQRSIGESKPKDDRFSNNAALNLNSSVPAGGPSPATQAVVKDAKTNPIPNAGNKKSDRENRVEASRLKPIDKEAPSATNVASLPTAVPSVGGGVEKKSSISNTSGEKDKKSHKHKKKDKNKDKEKDKERDKEKDKPKEKEKEKIVEKPVEAYSNTVTNKPEANNVRTIVGNVAGPAANSNVTNNSAPIPPTKKSQNKEKKAKEKASKEDRRQRAAELEPKSKVAKNATITIPNTSSSSSSALSAHNNNNVDSSDVDSLHSAQDLPQKTKLSTTATTAKKTPTQHSDSSNSSFPDLAPKQNSLLPPPAAPTRAAALLSTKEPKVKTGNKEQKVRNTEKNKAAAAARAAAAAVAVTAAATTAAAATTQTGAATTAAPPPPPPAAATSAPGASTISGAAAAPIAAVVQKPEKEDKKRKRSVNTTNTFIEPPLKQMKKDQAKSAREKSKSPSLRGTARGNSADTATAAFLPPPANSSGPTIALSPASSTTSNSTSSTNSGNISGHPRGSISPALPTEAISITSNVSGMATVSSIGNNVSAATTAANTTTTLPMEYLTELQELHHKIMTLQDNDELQQVVELIAATGCYEITPKTFDFDLCKLDRITVQRLQEFFSTSVS